MTAATLHRCLIAVLSQPERTCRRLTADEVAKLKAERLPGMYPDVNFRSDLTCSQNGPGPAAVDAPPAFRDHFPALTGQFVGKNFKAHSGRRAALPDGARECPLPSLFETTATMFSRD